MIDVNYSQMTLDGDNYIALNVVDAQDGHAADVFHFTSAVACENALKMCTVMNGDAADMQLLTGTINGGHALVFKSLDSSKAFIFSFANEDDLNAAIQLAIRHWELAHGDEFTADDDVDERDKQALMERHKKWGVDGILFGNVIGG